MDVEITEINQNESQPEEEVDMESQDPSPINTDIQKKQESEKDAKNCESINESDTLNELDIRCTDEHISREN